MPSEDGIVYKTVYVEVSKSKQSMSEARNKSDKEYVSSMWRKKWICRVVLWSNEPILYRYWVCHCVYALEIEQ